LLERLQGRALPSLEGVLKAKVTEARAEGGSLWARGPSCLLFLGKGGEGLPVEIVVAEDDNHLFHKGEKRKRQ